MAESANKARQRLRLLGSHLWGMIDLSKNRPCREPVENNPGTLFVQECVLQTLTNLEREGRPGILGIAGESRFFRTDFPEDLRSTISDHVGVMVKELVNQKEPSPVSISALNYRIHLAIFPDRDSARSWMAFANSSASHSPIARDEELWENPPEKQPRREDMTESEELSNWLATICKQSSNGFEAQLEQFKSVVHQVRTIAAKTLGESLNNHLKAMPHDSYLEKQEVATWVNAKLSEVGLAIRCPKTGRPSTLVADRKDAESSAGRFRLDNRNEEGQRERTMTAQELPEFELMEDSPRREAFRELRTRRNEEGKSR